MTKKSWEERMAELIERFAALSVIGADTSKLHEEITTHAAKRPVIMKEQENVNSSESQPVPATSRRPARRPTNRTKGGRS